jgi:NAD(P)H-hydrate epimerase
MGAAVLTAKACLRSGAGLLTVLIPEKGYEIMQATVPEAMVLTGEIIPPKKYDVIGIGPGLNTTLEAVKLVSRVVKRTKELTTQKSEHALTSKLLLDADALNILASDSELISSLIPLSILTPHPKEFERLFGKTNNEFESHERALQKAAQYKCFIILKGHHSFIATPMGQGYFNNTGNAGMATAGSGDVLTGILTGLSAQGYTALETCLLGVYLHGLAGDFAAAALSQEAMIAGDIIDFLGKAFKSLLQNNQPIMP